VGSAPTRSISSILGKYGIILSQRLRVSQMKYYFMDTREYDQLDALTSSSNMEISRLSVIIKNLKERVESLERNQTDLMDKINALEREKTG
jgi:predicted  nucleic acid-binding Zn-ribbon protein